MRYGSHLSIRDLGNLERTVMEHIFTIIAAVAGLLLGVGVSFGTVRGRLKAHDSGIEDIFAVLMFERYTDRLVYLDVYRMVSVLRASGLNAQPVMVDGRRRDLGNVPFALREIGHNGGYTIVNGGLQNLSRLSCVYHHHLTRTDLL